MKTVSELIVLAANTENTPELVDFWVSRYQYLLTNPQFFRLHANTINAAEQRNISTPITPVGEIFLNAHFNVDTRQFSIAPLQEIIFTATRFLDALIEVFDFDADTRIRMQKYRKLGLGIAQIGEFLDEFAPENPQTLIDDIGNFFSNFAYRASESLAEEKGECEDWDTLKKIIRSRSFEKWINTENGSVYDGLYITEHRTTQDIVSSPFEIIGRRNSHLLLLPPDSAWKKWSDRDGSNDGIRAMLEQKKEQKSQQNIAQYEIGELVKVIKKDSLLYQKMVQIEIIDTLVQPIQYHIKTQGIISNELFLSREIEPADATKLLEKIDQQVRVELYIFIFNDKGSRVMASRNKLVPTLILTPGMDLQTAVTNTLSQELEHFADILQIDVASFSQDTMRNTLQLGCVVQINKSRQISTWQDIDTLLADKMTEALLSPILAKIRVDDRAAHTIEQLQARTKELELVAQVSDIEVQKNTWTSYFETISARTVLTLTDDSRVECEVVRTRGALTGVALVAIETLSPQVSLFCPLATLTMQSQIQATGTLSINALKAATRSQDDVLISEILTKLEQLLAV